MHQLSKTFTKGTNPRSHEEQTHPLLVQVPIQLPFPLQAPLSPPHNLALPPIQPRHHATRPAQGDNLLQHIAYPAHLRDRTPRKDNHAEIVVKVNGALLQGSWRDFVRGPADGDFGEAPWANGLEAGERGEDFEGWSEARHDVGDEFVRV